MHEIINLSDYKKRKVNKTKDAMLKRINDLLNQVDKLIEEKFKPKDEK